ncbi:MAG: tRNA-dihydrouridine synthase [Thermoleophilia bacterium]|nr:tRNA-dihydrouridine synthase [Thermoleophilia bacterium]
MVIGPEHNPLLEPLDVGSARLPNRIVLAPMAGVTTSAFRRRMKAFGAGLVTTEMVSAYGLLYENRRTLEYLRFVPEERPVALQLFGQDPQAVAAAVTVLLEREPRPDVIDLNMGCPVRKVMKTGAGAALLGDPARAAAVAAAATAAATTVPVTAKIRSGLQPGEVVAVEVARRLEQAGIAALGVHPRAASQLYRGRADHSITAAVAAAVTVPVLASGDVTGAAAALRILALTGAAGVMVARSALGDPWLLADIVLGSTGPDPHATRWWPSCGVFSPWRLRRWAVAGPFAGSASSSPGISGRPA